MVWVDGRCTADPCWYQPLNFGISLLPPRFFCLAMADSHNRACSDGRNRLDDDAPKAKAVVLVDDGLSL